MFKLEVKDEGDQLRLIPQGEMDMYYTPQFKKEAVEAYEREKKDILIDGEALNYLDSTGLGGFIYLMNLVKENGHTIGLTNLQPNVEKLFVITKLDKVFQIKGEA